MLRLLCRRFGPAVLTLNYQAWSAAYSGHLEALRYLAEAVGGEATEGDEEGQAGDRGGRGGGASAGGAGAGAAGSRVASGSEWASVLRAAGYYGADLSLARLMYARCGRDTDILFAAATAGGSVETAEWAMEAQRAANKVREAGRWVHRLQPRGMRNAGMQVGGHCARRCALASRW